MDLTELLSAMKDVVGHGNVRWDAKDGEIRIYTGLTLRLEDGTVDPTLTLRQTADTVALETMGD